MTDNSTKDLALVERLTSNNYPIWSFKIKALMQEREVFQVINKAKPSDPDQAAAWEKANQKALNIMALTISNQYIIIIKKCLTAKEAWKALKAEFLSSTQSSKIRLYKKCFRATYIDGQDFRAHLNEMLMYFDQLSEMGSPLSDELQVSCVLASLSSTFDSAVTAIEAWDQSRVKMSNVKDLLIEVHEKKQDEIKDSKVEQLFKIQNQVPKQDNQNQGNRNPHEGLICGYCKKEGHIKRDCYKRMYNNEKNDAKSQWIKENISLKARKAGVQAAMFVPGPEDKMDAEWYVDSGASKHICSNSSLFHSLRKTNAYVIVANGLRIKADGEGDILLKIKNNQNQVATINLKGVLYFNNKNFSNLISVTKLVKSGCEMNFSSNGCCIVKNNKEFYTNRTSTGLYTVSSIKYQDNLNQAFLVNGSDLFCIHEWHRMLSHRNLVDIKKMKDKGIKFKACQCTDVCEACLQGKLARKSFPKQANKVDQPLDVIVSDVCGPFPIDSIQGFRYFITFTDVYSKYTEVRFIKQKSEVPNQVIQFIEAIKVQFRLKPKIFRSDRGTEYTNRVLQDYLRNQGIKFQCTVGYAPEQNGIAERKNRTLLEAARTMLIDSNLPKYLWSEAINEASFNLNRVHSKNDSQTPLEKYLSSVKFDCDFHIFGTLVYFKIPDQFCKKLDSKARKGYYVGHDNQSKGYRIYNPESRQVIVSREVSFVFEQNKSQNPVTKAKFNSSNSDRNVSSNQDKCPSPVVENQEPEYVLLPIDPLEGQEVTQPEQIPNPAIQVPQPNPDDNNYDNEEEEEEFHDTVDFPNEEVQVPIQARPVRATAGQPPIRFRDYELYSVSSYCEPKSYAEVLRSPEKEEWLNAMNEEIQSLNQNQAWELVDLPESRKTVGSKWVFKRKHDQDGKIIEYKARLVAQGFSQKYGEDYDEVFAPVTRSSTFRLLLSVSGKRKLKIKQFDIKTAFLNGELTEEIYLKQPPGFVINNQVYKLKKSLYGLKQAARVWNLTIHKVLVDDGFIQSQADKCLYIKNVNNKECYLIIHVDDILVAGTDMEIINQTHDILSKHFKVKDLGTVKYFLGITVTQDNDENFYINQENYIKKIASEAGLEYAKPSRYPLDPGFYKFQNPVPLPEDNDYRKLVGMLLYVSTNTRPDIASSVCILSQKVSKPSQADLVEVKRVIRYLATTKDFKLKLSSQNPDKIIEFYSDANWAEDRHDRKSNSGYIGFVYGGTITWGSRKQVCVSLSSTEAEYIALTDTTQEILWFKNLCHDFNINIKYPILVQADNQSAIKMVSNHKFSNSTKHVETRYHFIKDIKEKNVINIVYCPAELNIADMLTKALGATKLKQLRELAGINN